MFTQFPGIGEFEIQSSIAEDLEMAVEYCQECFTEISKVLIHEIVYRAQAQALGQEICLNRIHFWCQSMIQQLDPLLKSFEK